MYRNFIKNIDNVVPDRLKKPTINYKKALAGVLLKIQEKLFFYQKELNEKHPAALDSAFLAAASNFLENTLNTKPATNHYYTEKEELYHYLKEKLNRPLRVCGMVKNEGEPGGGPAGDRLPAIAGVVPGLPGLPGPVHPAGGPGGGHGPPGQPG